MQPEETHKEVHQEPPQEFPAEPYAGAGDAAAPGAASADAVRELNAKLDAANARAEEHYQALLRAAADAENARRRGQEEAAKARKFGIESFAESLLPVMDSLEAALADPTGDAAKLREGVELTLRQLASALEKNRVTVINPAGERFDPHAHQAIATRPDAAIPAQHVASVLQKGYRIADRVLRPALVAVSEGDT